MTNYPTSTDFNLLQPTSTYFNLLLTLTLLLHEIHSSLFIYIVLLYINIRVHTPQILYLHILHLIRLSCLYYIITIILYLPILILLNHISLYFLYLYCLSIISIRYFYTLLLQLSYILYIQNTVTIF